MKQNTGEWMEIEENHLKYVHNTRYSDPNKLLVKQTIIFHARN